MANIDITDAGGGSLSNGVLQLENGVAMDTTLRYVADQANTKSQLLLATNATTVEGTLKVKTNNVEYLDVEDGSGNNRFTISRPALGQKVALDFASNPVGSTTIVGSIRTFTDGTNLNDIVQFREDGQTTFVERVNVEADSLVTTQTSSVIASTTTNANLVIAPNGTGALITDIPDGTVTGGNARGTNAVDLQTIRGTATQVASGTNSTISGGRNNSASGADSTISGGVGNIASGPFSISAGGNTNTASGNFSTVSGGNINNATSFQSTVAGGGSNTASGQNSVVGGGELNTASSNHSTISGGQSNTASTNTHATVVGGQGNTSSGAHSVSGGILNTASGLNSGVLSGNSNIASGNQNFVGGGINNTASGSTSVVVVGGNGNVAGHFNCTIVGGTSNSCNRDGGFIGGGTRNQINSISQHCTIAGGFENSIILAGADFSSIAGGYRAGAYLYSQNALASGYFATQGDAQQSSLTARRQATLTTSATTVLSLDGTGATNLIIPNGNNRMWNVQVRWVAVVTAITGTAAGVTVGDTKTSTDLLAVAKRAGNTTVSAHTSAGTHVIETIAGSLSAANIAYTAGASQEMAITFTGPTFAGGGSVTMRVVAAISLTEVAY